MMNYQADRNFTKIIIPHHLVKLNTLLIVAHLAIVTRFTSAIQYAEKLLIILVNDFDFGRVD